MIRRPVRILRRLRPRLRSAFPRRCCRSRRRGLADAAYLAWVRGLPCLAADHPESPCWGSVQAHHAGHHGLGRLNDYCAVPLCAAHHLSGFGSDAVHGIGRRRFERKFAVDFEEVIGRLNLAWLARLTWRKAS